MKTSLFKISLFALACVAGLFACGSPAPIKADQPVAAVLEVPPDTVFNYGFRNMAWDGQRLWQYVREKDNVHLRAYNLKGQLVRKVPLANDEIPIHRSMDWSQDSLWLLDTANTLYRLSPAGKLLAKLPLSSLPGTGSASLLAFAGEKLWVFRKSFYDPKADQEVPPALVRLDPASGKVLETIEIQDEDFARIPFEEIVSDQGSFYLSRSHIFSQKDNLVYKVGLNPLRIEKITLPRIFTGLATLFFVNQKLYGMELLEFLFCHDSCRGVLRELSLTAAPAPKPEPSPMANGSGGVK
ncbi:MAG: hypothetical protein ACAI44_09175 [Candidatus Sericytochromatia bacterium]